MRFGAWSAVLVVTLLSAVPARGQYGQPPPPGYGQPPPPGYGQPPPPGYGQPPPGYYGQPPPQQYGPPPPPPQKPEEDELELPGISARVDPLNPFTAEVLSRHDSAPP